MQGIKIDSLDEPFNIEPAELQLDGYYVRELRFSVRDDLDETTNLTIGTGLHVQPSKVMLCSAPTIGLTIYTGKHVKDPSKFRLMLEVASDEEEDDTPYRFTIKLVGYFSMVETKSLGDIDIFWYRNALMLLYSTARELVASVTSRGPFPAFILPTFSFSISEKSWKAIEANLIAGEKELVAKKQPRQLSASTKKASKKSASKKKLAK